MDQKYKKCGVCGKDIEDQKFRMHEPACLRLNYKCPQCGDCVLKSDKDQH